MKRVGSIETYEAMRRAFRDLTDIDSDGAATRARVLTGAGRDIQRRDRRRRIAAPIAAVLLATGSISAALAVVHRWRAPAASAIAPATGAEIASRPGASDGHPVRIIPPESITALPEPALVERRPPPLGAVSDAETRAYSRAHQSHFADEAPARALDAWDAYLAAFPHGAFAPEAAYNRAICLVRLERRADAVRALRRIAAAPPGSYRREEALRLLDWLVAPGAD